MPPDLDSEFLEALRRVGWDDSATPAARWLAARGFFAMRRAAVGGVGVAHATLHDAVGLFEPADADGDRVLMAPVWDGAANPECKCPADAIWSECACAADRTLIDLVAWNPSEPTRLYRRTGEAAVIGIGGVEVASDTFMPPPLRLFRSVEDLIRHGGEIGAGNRPDCPMDPAAVVLDLARAAWLLRDVVEIIADDLALAEDVEAALLATRPALPRLMVAASSRRAA
ncbi:MAG: hypothetical protein HQL37_06930 [Alphaproteobacteria bacterium]|nr:hypothetical protein [Alphaproteobacteria bacterium]